MANGSTNDEADRRATGAGRPKDDPDDAGADMRPGLTGGGANYLPETDRAGGAVGNAAAAEGTVGAVGEMDFTGAPAGTTGGAAASGGSGSGETRGGGPGGGAAASGGTGPGVAGAGPQSVESTLAVLGDRELSSAEPSPTSFGGAGGAAAGESDAASDDARTDGG